MNAKGCRAMASLNSIKNVLSLEILNTKTCWVLLLTMLGTKRTKKQNETDTLCMQIWHGKKGMVAGS